MLNAVSGWGGTVRWKERRGVAKAEDPGELTSEVNRPKGGTPV